MDTWGIVWFLVGTIGYFATKKEKAGWLLLAGFGLGLIYGAIWAMSIVNQIFSF